ncbi:MAG: prolipoprotein diacylglyceryl transferase [Nanobdellota archaeon]
MFVNQLDPVIFEFFGLQIRWYGIVYAAGFIYLYFFLMFLAKHNSIDNFEKDDVEPFLIGLIISMIIGSRLFHTFVYNFIYYITHPLEIIMIWNGGLSFHGALFFIALWIFYYCRKRGIHFFSLTDFLVVPAAFFLAIGRFANFINGELIGVKSNISWAVKFEDYEGFRHPTQIYESIKNLFLFSSLILIKFVQGRIFRRYVPGLMTIIFLMGYGIMRFFIEFLKEGATVVAGLNIGQILSLAMIIFSVYLIKTLHRLNNEFNNMVITHKEEKKRSKKKGSR